MILTNCAACAAPLAHDAPRCVRCKLRYCNATASMTTGAAATSRCVRKYTAAATQSNITPTKNTRRPSRSRSMIEAEETLTDVAQKFRRLLGPSHPDTKTAEVSALMATGRIIRLFGPGAIG